MSDPSIVRFRSVLASAWAALESRRGEVNDLNVFPVADGDTGDNMSMTLQAVLAELDRLNGQPIDDIGRDELVHALARAALLGARGNSGVILSQVVRGAAEELASRPGELVDPVLVAAALARAADAAYASVREPAEGTMLSAVRAMAHRVAQDLAHMETPRLGSESAPEQQETLLAEVLEHALEAGREAVERGPEQLAALRRAGVVDAGAYGLTVIMAGLVAGLRRREGYEPSLQAPATPPRPRSLHPPQHESSRFRYCTNFAVTGTDLEPRAFIEGLEEIGDCVQVVGDERTLRVHLHTDEPARAVGLLERTGEVSRLEVADMREQLASRRARLGDPEGASPGGEGVDHAACGVVAVASGAGLVAMLEQLGAVVVDGGATLNPSTNELLAAIRTVSAEEVLVLPGTSNVTLAAERAAELSEKPVYVVATPAPQASLAALLPFDPARRAADNTEPVAAAAARASLGGVAPAQRDDADGRFSAGEAVGYAGEQLVAWGDPAPTLSETLAQVCRGAEVVTCLAGQGAPLGDEDVAATAPGGVELELHEGGQPVWWWLLCAE